MSDIAAVLRTAFAAESAEHLQAIEPVLVSLDHIGPSGIADLFRGFHSLKGLAGAMGRYGMEAVAHQAENVLGRVRDHGARVTEAMVDALLAATDALRAGRDAAIAGEPDRPPTAALLTQLSIVMQAVSGPAVNTPALPPPSHGPAADLGADEEMLPLFAEVLQGTLPEVAAILTSGEADRVDLLETLDRLGRAAGIMDMDALVEAFANVTAALGRHTLPLGPEGRLVLLPLLHELADKAALLGELVDVDAGAAALRTALDGTPTSIEPRSAALGPALAGVAAAIRTGNALPHAAADAQAAVPHAAAYDLHARALLALLGDILPRLCHGTLRAGPALADALDLLASNPLDEQAAAARTVTLQDALLYPDGTPAHSGVSGPLVESLTPEAHSQLTAALKAGQHAYALVLYLEDAPLIASGLLAWLRTIGGMPGSRSVFHGGEFWVELLLLSPLSPDTLAAGLLETDPDRICLRDLRGLRPSGETPISLGGPAVAAAPVRSTATAGELRVSGAALDRFMDVITEARAHLAALMDALEQLGGEQPDPDLARTRHDLAREQATRLDTELRRLHGTAIDVRIVPVDLAFNRLPRLVRTLAREQGKVVDLQLDGRGIRIDKAIVDRLIEPLLHMVRNAVDHGIEAPDDRARAGKPRRAQLLISAVQGIGEVSITIGDDGRGLDRDRILARAVERGLVQAGAFITDEAVFRLIFLPGFSTAASVTETSGRGVGMDVVLTEVHRLGGEVAIDTQPGQGTRFTLHLPLTAATLSVLLIRAGGQCLGIPEAAVAHVIELPREALLPLDGRPAVRFANQEVPVRPLAAVLWPGEPVPGDALPPLSRLVIVRRGDNLVALEVDEILRRQELLLLRLHPSLADCPFLGGAAVLGSGEVVFSLEADSLVAAALADTWHAAA